MFEQHIVSIQMSRQEPEIILTFRSFLKTLKVDILLHISYCIAIHELFFYCSTQGATLSEMKIYENKQTNKKPERNILLPQYSNFLQFNYMLTLNKDAGPEQAALRLPESLRGPQAQLLSNSNFNFNYKLCVTIGRWVSQNAILFQEMRLQF